MISFETFMLGLLITSTVTALTTEAIKKILGEQKITCCANTLTGIVALVLSVAVGAAYAILNSITFTPQVVVYMIAHVFMSWLCAMVGYDKVVQTIGQIKSGK